MKKRKSGGNFGDRLLVYNATVHPRLRGEHGDVEEVKHDPKKEILDLVNSLENREGIVLCHRLGLLGMKKVTYDEIGKELKITRERVRQIYAKALRKCRHASRGNLVQKITHKELRNAIGGE